MPGVVAARFRYGLLRSHNASRPRHAHALLLQRAEYCPVARKNCCCACTSTRCHAAQRIVDASGHWRGLQDCTCQCVYLCPEIMICIVSQSALINGDVYALCLSRWPQRSAGAQRGSTMDALQGARLTKSVPMAAITILLQSPGI